MKIYCDFHIHSRYARATSKNLNLETLSEGAKQKGIGLLGTGDFTHPLWFNEIRERLVHEEGDLFSYNGVLFMLTAEVCTIFDSNGKSRKVHHIIHAPSFEVAKQVNEAIGGYGNLKSDGRPVLLVSAAELVEKIMAISDQVMIYPAHNWTPFFGCMGSKTGFDSVDECYEDQAKHIFALETGLSSDPMMNWRLSKLDRFTLLSNSDAHSANPWRLGREANAFELKKPDYNELYNAIKGKDKKKFLYTIEVEPSYGKYHYDGHRNCKVSLTPEETKRNRGRCPKCGKMLTIGVLSRVNELADRPEGFVPQNAIPFKKLIPLYEIISYATGSGQLYSKKVAEENYKLIKRFGNELNVLLNVPREDLIKETNEGVSNAIIAARSEKVAYTPGYDGEYGIPKFDESCKKEDRKYGLQSSIAEF